MEVTTGDGCPQVSRADRPPPADEPGCGELKDEHRTQAIHKAKHQSDASKQSDGAANQQEKHESYTREDFWKTKFVTPHPDIIEWSKVYRRVTGNRDTGELIEDVRIEPENKPRDYEYSLCKNPLEDMCLNLQTTFYFRKVNVEKPDISEVYSPPRITKEADKRGLKGGFALDLTVRRKDGKMWDFSKRIMRDEATKMVLEQQPFMLISSPPCTMFSILQNGNRGRFTKAHWEEKLANAKVHIDFSLKLFELQRRMGNHFLYEHPRTAASWELPEMKEFMKKTGVIDVLANMCRFGMMTEHKGEVGKVAKATRFLTSSPECAKRLAKICDEKCKEDKHIAVWGVRAKAAQRYPPALCRAVVEGVRSEKMRAETNMCEIEVDHMVDLAVVNEIEDSETRHEGYMNWAEAWDDVTGKALDPQEVGKARAKEMEYVRGMNVYEVVDIRECLMMTGRAPIKSRWIDMSKGDDRNWN